jgi:uncharacterized membrane protein SpoIIM required for sporulation
MKVFTGKKGYSTGFSWIYFLLLIFVLGFLFILIAYSYDSYFKGTADSLINSNPLMNDSMKTEALAQGDKYTAFFHATPVIIFVTLVIGLILGAIAIKNRPGE